MITFFNLKNPTWFILFVAVSACTKLPKAIPTTYGKVNRVHVIMDDALWDGPVGDTLRSYFGSAYPMMPAPEPYFQLRQLTATEVLANQLKRELRTYLIVANINDKNSSVAQMVRKDLGQEKLQKAGRDSTYNTAVFKNKWARPQLLIYLFAQDEAQLVKLIKDKFQTAAARINEHDRTILKADLYQGGRNKDLEEDIRQTFLVNIHIPYDYVLALEKDNAMWIRKMDDKYLSNIIISKYPYHSESLLSVDSLIAKRNQLGKLLISSSEPGSYMTTNDKDLPIYQTTRKINGAFVKELRGIWEMVNDFAGGPFFCYAILSPDKKSIFFIDVFVLAPGEPKQQAMQYLEEIVQTVRFVQ